MREADVSAAVSAKAELQADVSADVSAEAELQADVFAEADISAEADVSRRGRGRGGKKAAAAASAAVAATAETAVLVSQKRSGDAPEPTPGVEVVPLNQVLRRKCWKRLTSADAAATTGSADLAGSSTASKPGTKEKTYRKNERKNERPNGRTSEQAKNRAYNYGILATQQRDLMGGNTQSLLGNVGAKFTGLAMPAAAIDATDVAGEDEEKTSAKVAARTKAGTPAEAKAPVAPVLESPPPLAPAAPALAKAKAPAALDVDTSIMEFFSAYIQQEDPAHPAKSATSIESLISGLSACRGLLLVVFP